MREHADEFIFGFGFADERWDPRVFCWLPDAPFWTTGPLVASYCYWSNGSLNDVTGETDSMSWSILNGGDVKRGDVVGVVAEFNRREVHFFLNGKWMAMRHMHAWVNRLWPVVSLFTSGDAVMLLSVPSSKYTLPPQSPPHTTAT